MTADEERRFEEQRALTGHFREALKAFAEDARRVVREEIAASEPDHSELESVIRQVAREELARTASKKPPGVSWSTAAAGAALTLTILMAGWGVMALAGPLGGEAPTQVAEAAEAALVSTAGGLEETAAAPPHTAARYDSLFAGRHALLLDLAARVAKEAPPGVAAALATWRSGDISADPVVHNAFVQFSLRQTVDSTVSVDGSILRSPTCRGHSCSALIAHWRAEAGGAGYPPLSPEPGVDSLGLGVVERLLVLRVGAAE